MLSEPNLDVMLHAQGLSNKFALVTLALKRAKHLIDGSPRRVETDCPKAVSIALQEIYEGKILTRDKDAPNPEPGPTREEAEASALAVALATPNLPGLSRSA